MSDGFLQLGNIQVATTTNRGQPPEFWAQVATDKICGISESAPDHVRQQALAFKHYIYRVILDSIRESTSSDKVTIMNLLTQQGHEEMAKIIEEL